MAEKVIVTGFVANPSRITQTLGRKAGTRKASKTPMVTLSLGSEK